MLVRFFVRSVCVLGCSVGHMGCFLVVVLCWLVVRDWVCGVLGWFRNVVMLMWWLL